MKKQLNRAWFRWAFRRLRRGLRFKAQLSCALLAAGLFSLARPKQSWPRIKGAFLTWLRFAQQERSTPFWIYVGRMRTCKRCPLFYSPLQTCGSPLRKDLRDVGCHCYMPLKSAAIEATCFYRDATNNDTSFGWDPSLTRLSNLPARSVSAGCSGCKEIILTEAIDRR